MQHARIQVFHWLSSRRPRDTFYVAVNTFRWTNFKQPTLHNRSQNCADNDRSKSKLTPLTNDSFSCSENDRVLQPRRPSIICSRFKLLRVTWGWSPSWHTLGEKQAPSCSQSGQIFTPLGSFHFSWPACFGALYGYSAQELGPILYHYDNCRVYSYGSDFTSTLVHLATVKLMQPNAIHFSC